ncbi:hypothetical protein ANN_00538 [Periplaneta americana]|uniref:Uncharacterized protein n=1 Tax=Periplaneta americana TaxID=6978 RepID=A0ABQ8TR14_PERAM|nr:hypothetical protein ANN_00538 [Periplaneta americana]
MELLEDILFIDSNFKIVSKSIILLESSKLKLSEALNIVDKVSQTVIQNNNSLISEKMKCHDKTSEVGVLKSSDFPFFKYALKPTDYAVRSNFALEMLQQENDNFLDCVVFSDESTFHLSGNVNTHNVRIWESKNPHEFVQSERDSPKLNGFVLFPNERFKDRSVSLKLPTSIITPSRPVEFYSPEPWRYCSCFRNTASR